LYSLYGFSRTCGGDPGVTVPAKHDTLVFPAHTGVILQLEHIAESDAGFSRTYGGDPAGASSWLAQEAFFPHTRGIDYIK